MKLVIFDWKWTLYHPPSRQLLPGAQELIDYLRTNNVKMVVVGMDQGGSMDDAVDNLGVRDYFHDIRFIKTRKSPELFQEYAKEFPANQVWVVGDRVRGEIDTGNRIGANTAWMKVGTFSNELPQSADEEPDYTFASLHDLLEQFSQNSEAASEAA